MVHHFYVVCLLDCGQSLFSSKICKREYLSSEVPWVVRYAAQIPSLTDFRAKERLLAVYMSFSVSKLFCCFLTGWIEGSILLAIMNSLLSWCLHDLATELIVGKIMYKYDKHCKFYILGQGSTFLFICLLFVILLLNYVAANAFGIWNLWSTGKSVTKWVTHMLL